MNYRHIYHAGNFADVFKHVILCLCLDRLQEKDAPFFVLDTHAGIGKYDLFNEKSLRTLESDSGIKKMTHNISILPKRYLEILAKLNSCRTSELGEKLKFYSGSPIIIKDYLRGQDRAILAELNSEDFLQLRRHFAGNSKFTLVNEDGFHLLKSKLPPLEKRGLIIMDPAFEKDQSKVSADYEKIITSLQDAYKRFANGVYLIWYPIIRTDQKVLRKFYREISELKFEKKMHVTFDIGYKKDETKMTACGMFIFNAPWQLDEKLEKLLPLILKTLSKEENDVPASYTKT